MPMCIIEGPALDLETKRKLARSVTDALAEGYGIDAKEMIVVIRENAPENVAFDGCLLCDGRAAPM